MAQLIQDMMLLSQVNQTELEFNELNLSMMATTVANNTVDTLGMTNLHIEVENDLIATGDERLVQILLDNLVSNAMKYSSKVEQPKIEIGFDKAKLAYYVKDNGVGFDMEYVDKIFIPFQRLHRADEYERTGIGLATVARIIARHGGKIWVFSEEGKGATFYFTLYQENSGSSHLRLVQPAG